MNLQQAIDEGARAIKMDPNRGLPLRNRILLWIAMAPRVTIDDRFAVDGPGLRARYALARSCVLKVLPIWEADFRSAEMAPIWKRESFTGDMPRGVLEFADEVMADRRKVERGREFYTKGWLYADNVGVILYDSKSPRNYVNAVCYAACCCLAVALYDEYFNENNPDDPTALVRDPYSFDTADYARVAYARGFPRDAESDIKRRSEFWEWYLSEISKRGRES